LLRACLSIFSVKPYSLQERLILEVGISEFKSTFTSHLESVSIELTTSLLAKLIVLALSKGIKRRHKIKTSGVDLK
jgi:hypothetical protein